MNVVRITGAAVAFLFFETMICAQPDGSSGKRASRVEQAQVRQQLQPEQRDRQAQSESVQRQSTPPERTRQQARAWQQKRGWLQKGGWEGHDTFRQGRAGRWSADHRTWAQRGGYGGPYVPPHSFNLYFGPQHLFRIRARPTMYLGYPRFEHGGYSFLLVDPYPENWSATWYDTDDVYVDYNDGYYLYDCKYPQVGLAVTIAL